MKYKSTDHEGNTFDSVSMMCEHWGVNRLIYAKRIERGKTIEEALTMKKEIKDHLGNSFKSTAKMCDYWNVNRFTYNYRIKHDKSVEEALTGGINHKQTAAIIYGKEWRTIELCQ